MVQSEAAWRGMKYVVRDPNNNPSAMQQALTALVNDKPDVLIVQNPSVTLLMKELKRAESQGTHVIQINMSSNYKSDAFVGADWARGRPHAGERRGQAVWHRFRQVRAKFRSSRAN